MPLGGVTPMYLNGVPEGCEASTGWMVRFFPAGAPIIGLSNFPDISIRPVLPIWSKTQERESS